VTDRDASKWWREKPARHRLRVLRQLTRINPREAKP